MFKKINYGPLMIVPIILLFLTSSMVYAESSDYETNWAAKEISKWQSSGIINGYPDGSFKPNAQITRAEFFKVIAETMGLTETVNTNFTDVAADAWYKDYIAKVVAAGYVQGDGNNTVRPKDPISRQEASKILSIAFNIPAAENEANSFKDAKDIADWSKGYVGGLAQGGYIKGYEDHTFRPAKHITRAESVKMFDNLAGELYIHAGTYSDMEVPGNALINTKGVALKNVTIRGNLYLTAGIGEGSVTLDNVTVMGEIVITGGGENGIYIKNSSINKVKINKKGALITISDNAKISRINVLADGVKINGREVGKGSVVKFENGMITEITNPSSGGSPGGSPGSGPSSVSVTGISLNQTATSLKVGETITLTATVAPANATNKNVRWSSSNEMAAIVENGKITAKAEGTAVITVTTEDGNKTATCTVTVTRQSEEATIYDVTTSTHEASKKVTIEGYIRSGSGKAVAVKITDPLGNVDWIGQTVSGSEGKFTFEFTPNHKTTGEYSAAFGTNGLSEPVLVMFNYTAD